MPGWQMVSSRVLNSIQVGDEFTLRQCRKRRTDRLARLLARFGITLHLGDVAQAITVRLPE
jgi:hypothetical protein